jgi:hypothetical protein
VPVGLPSISTEDWAVNLGGVAAGAAFGAGLVLAGHAVVLTAAAFCVGAVVAASLLRPARVFSIGLGLLIVVPPYAASIPTEPPHPAVAVFLILACALLVRPTSAKPWSTRVTPIGVAVALFFVALGLSVAVGVRSRHDAEPLFLGLLPMFYCGSRLIADGLLTVRQFAKAWVFAAGVVVPWALYEAATGTNLLARLRLGDPGANGVWLALQSGGITRLGEHRVAASLGHPIAFGMFMAIAAILAAGLAVTSETTNRRLGWYGVSAAFVAVQSLALSRTGWLVLAFGCAFLVAGTKGVVRQRVGRAVVIGGALACVAVLLDSRSREVFGLGDPYRSTLFHSAITRHAFGLFGNRHTEFQGVVGSASNPAPSIDSAFISVADHWGYIALVALVGIVLATGYCLLATRAEPMYAVVVAATLAGFLGLAVVALITQMQCLLFALLGVASGGMRTSGALRGRRSCSALSEPPSRAEDFARDLTA